MKWWCTRVNLGDEVQFLKSLSSGQLHYISVHLNILNKDF